MRATVTVAGLAVEIEAENAEDFVAEMKGLKEAQAEIDGYLTELNQLNITKQVFNNPPPQTSATYTAPATASTATGGTAQTIPAQGQYDNLQPGQSVEVGTGAPCNHNVPRKIIVGRSKKNSKLYKGTYCGLHGQLNDRDAECDVEWDRGFKG